MQIASSRLVALSTESTPFCNMEEEAGIAGESGGGIRGGLGQAGDLKPSVVSMGRGRDLTLDCTPSFPPTTEITCSTVSQLGRGH